VCKINLIVEPHSLALRPDRGFWYVNDSQWTKLIWMCLTETVHFPSVIIYGYWVLRIYLYLCENSLCNVHISQTKIRNSFVQSNDTCEWCDDVVWINSLTAGIFRIDVWINCNFFMRGDTLICSICIVFLHILICFHQTHLVGLPFI
jgi:hypothetical protein